MARLGIRITDEMESALNGESAKTHITTSELVRMAIAKFLTDRGHTLTEAIEWGGKRESGKPEDTED